MFGLPRVFSAQRLAGAGCVPGVQPSAGPRCCPCGRRCGRDLTHTVGLRLLTSSGERAGRQGPALGARRPLFSTVAHALASLPPFTHIFLLLGASPWRTRRRPVLPGGSHRARWSPQIPKSAPHRDREDIVDSEDGAGTPVHVPSGDVRLGDPGTTPKEESHSRRSFLEPPSLLRVCITDTPQNAFS